MSKIGHNAPPLSEGWIARHRSVRDHWLVGHGLPVRPADPKKKRCHSQGEAWEDLLMECRYEDGFVVNGGKKMALERGSLIGAVSWLGQRWNWTPQTVRTFLDKLEQDGMIERHVPGTDDCNKHAGKVSTVITICNYERFQRPEIEPQQTDQQTDQQTNHKQATNDQQMSNNIYKDNKGTKEQRNKKEEGEAALPLVANATPAPLEALRAFEAYNALAQRIGLPLARSLTPQRRKALGARIREHGGYQSFEIALANIERSAFLRGGNSRGWRCDLDFLTQPRSFAKVVDGTYGNGAHGDTVPKESAAQRMARLMGHTCADEPEILTIEGYAHEQ